MSTENTPLTLDHAKDKIAQKYGFATWQEFDPNQEWQLENDQVVELMLQSHKAAAWEEGAEAQYKSMLKISGYTPPVNPYKP